MEIDKKNTILIVEDEEQYILALTKILRPEYTVYAVKDGRDAILNAEKIQPHVILLDIIMPEMDGFAVMEALKASDKTEHIPIIVISGLSEIGDELKGLSMGAVDYITKPFTQDIVKLRVKNQMKILNQMNLIIEKELAEKSSRTKIEFLTNMSHEMLTPMNAIMGMTKIAQMGINPERTVDCLNEIDSASKQLLSLINNLLDISVYNEESIILVDSVFSLNIIFRDIININNARLNNRNHIIIHNIDPSIPMLLIGDEKRLSQVISNLLDNAIKFTPEGGKINLSARMLEECKGAITLQIEVKDSGIGITKEDKENIFKLFEKADNSLTTSHKGSGLGLTISKKIIEMMGGKIHVESEPGKGSIFTFTCKLQEK